jgi:hypothetical protein
MNVFEANAVALEKLKERVDETFQTRSESSEHTAGLPETTTP